jgi:GNAT superfamily N-acetyltransferase
MAQWWTHCGGFGKLFVIIIRNEAGHLTGIAPLYLSSGPMRMRRLGFLGDGMVGSDYLDFLLDESCAEQAVTLICSTLLERRSEWDYIELADTRVDSVAATIFRDKMAAKLSISVRPSCLCPYIHLPATPEIYLTSLRPKLRQNLRRRERALSREGRVEFVTVQSGPELEAAFDDLMRLHKARFAALELGSAFLHPQVGPFHRAALRSLAETGRVQIHLLKLNGEAIAALYSLLTAKKICAYQVGMNPDYSRFGIGTLLIPSAITAAILNQCREFDFLRGGEPYKTEWADATHRLSTLLFFDDRVRSRIARAAFLIRKWLSLGKVVVRSAATNIQRWIGRSSEKRLPSRSRILSEQGSI